MSIFFKFLLIINLIFIKNLVKSSQSPIIDPNGYIAYCPCLANHAGYFGQQVDYFLGSLRFSNELNRTLILPPWIEYDTHKSPFKIVPFDEYFQVEPLKEYHRVITMHKFMETIAPEIWPPEKRTAFCFKERRILYQKNDTKSCNAKALIPFVQFWDEFSIDFNNSEIVAPLTFDVINKKEMIDKWNEKYPSKLWPVLAFSYAPASYPVQFENLNLQKYLIWPTEVMNKTFDYFMNEYFDQPYIGIHIRGDVHWENDCGLIKNNFNVFAAAQCLGYQNERGNATMDMCSPDQDIVIREIKRVIKEVASTSPNDPIRSVFVTSESAYMIKFFNQELYGTKVRAYDLDEPDLHVELSILALSKHFIGNCISPLSALVKRQRDINGLPTSFWGYPTGEKTRTDDSLYRKSKEL